MFFASILPARAYPRERLILFCALLALSAACWAWLIYQDWAMHHMEWVEMAMPASSTWNISDLALIFNMWAIMMAAMMVPSAMPLVLLFAAVNRRRRENSRPYTATAFFLGGYLAVWTAFSVCATLAQWALTAAAWMTPMMENAQHGFGAAVLVLAGVYQLSPFKQACLKFCRAPFEFLMTQWREGKSGAWVMGLRHGAYCTACCWLLMALLFVVGVMNLAWVAAISLFVLLEKILPSSRWLSYGSGLALIVWGVGLALN
ncbi:MAG: DUF2182 domain-containing protein [Burkholderiales bacterium]